MAKTNSSSIKLLGMDRMIMISVGVALIVGFFLGAQYMKNGEVKQQEVSIAENDTLKTYTNQKFGFQFQYPAEYIVEENESIGGTISLKVLKGSNGENSTNITIDVGSPLAERSDYYFGGMKWTTNIIDTLKELENGAIFDGVKENSTKISNIDIGGFQGVKYTSEPMEGSKTINVALTKGDLTLLLMGANSTTQKGVDTSFDMEVFDEIVRTLAVVKK